MDSALIAEVRKLSSDVATATEDVKSLTVSVEARRGETAQTARELRAEMHLRTVVIGWFLAAIVLALILVIPAVTVATLSNRNRLDENNRRFCPFIGILIPRPGDPLPPPGAAGERGRRVIAAARIQSRAWGCPTAP